MRQAKSSGRLIAAIILIQFAFVMVAAQSAPTQITPQEKEAVVYGVRIHYLEAGTGAPVILLHGLGGSSQAWSMNTPALATKYRVIVPDQIGFGRSDKPLVNYRIGTYVDFLDQFLKQLKLDRVSLVGGSMGGWISASYAIRFPEKVERLVLVGSAGYPPPIDFDYRTLYSLNPSTREGMKLLASKVFYNKLFQTDAVIDQILAQRITAGDGYTINSIIESIGRKEDLLDDRVKSIKQPTLILWGREDGLIPVSEGERFKREISNSTLIVFDQCGHAPNVEKATEFNAALLKFMTGA